MRIAEAPMVAFERHLEEVKTSMNPKSRHELIKIISALLVDNYAMKLALENRERNVFQKMAHKLKGMFRA